MAIKGISMAGEASKSPGLPPASRREIIGNEKAFGEKKVLDDFFGMQPVNRPHVVEKPKMREQPWWVMLLLIGGMAFILISAITLAFRNQFSESWHGYFIGIFGTLLLAVGVVIYFKPTGIGGGSQPSLPPETAPDLINKQIEQIRTNAAAAFGRSSSTDLKLLLGLGDRSWGKEFKIRLVNDQTYVTSLNVLAVDLGTEFLSLREYGLHVPTATICAQRSSRIALSDIVDVATVARRSPALLAWESAETFAHQLDTLAKSDRTRAADKIADTKTKFAKLALDQLDAEEFFIEIKGGRQIAVNVVQDHDVVASKRALPIGGMANLERVRETWDAINAARLAGDGGSKLPSMTARPLSESASPIAKLDGMMTPRTDATVVRKDGADAIPG